jgi:hypothetical protein
MKTVQTKSVNGQRFHRAPTVVLYCFEECLMNFVVNLLLAESGTICLLQWAEKYSITSSDNPINFQLSTDFESRLATRSQACSCFIPQCGCFKHVHIWYSLCFGLLPAIHHSRLCNLLPHTAADPMLPGGTEKINASIFSQNRTL